MYTTTTNEVNVNSQALDTLGNRKEQKSLRTTKKEKENTARGSRFFFCAILLFLSSSGNAHTHIQNNKEIYMKERRGKGGINYFGLFFACCSFSLSLIFLRSSQCTHSTHAHCLASRVCVCFFKSEIK